MDQAEVGLETSPVRLVKTLYIHPYSELVFVCFALFFP